MGLTKSACACSECSHTSISFCMAPSMSDSRLMSPLRQRSNTGTATSRSSGSTRASTTRRYRSSMRFSTMRSTVEESMRASTSWRKARS